MMQKSLFLSVVGLPNVGKSTLVNALIGSKISSVSRKPQTTIENIRGILTQDESQIVFLDTPGFFVPKQKSETNTIPDLNMGIEGTDIICIVEDGKNRFNTEILEIIKKNKDHKDIIFVINKTDKAKEENILYMAKKVFDLGVEDIFFTSCKTNRGIEKLRNHLIEQTKEGEWHYEAEMITDRDINSRLNDITREKSLTLLKKELPYTIKVHTKQIIKSDSIYIIKQNIEIKKPRHKTIIIGREGELIKRIALYAAEDMEEVMGKKVKLLLSVKNQKETEK